MKKLISMIVALAVFSCMMAVPCFAAAEEVFGSTSQKVTFRVDANSSGSYIVLSSNTGLARVAQHNWRGIYDGDADEATHGFYYVQVLGSGVEDRFYWAPSATTQKDSTITCEEFQYGFNVPGTYFIAIYPLDESQSASFWRMDWIKNWIYDATWMVTVKSDCNVAITDVKNR